MERRRELTKMSVAPAGFNVEKVEHKNVAFTVWDVGGQDKLRPLWRQYLSNSDALVSSEFRACHQCCLLANSERDTMCRAVLKIFHPICGADIRGRLDGQGPDWGGQGGVPGHRQGPAHAQQRHPGARQQVGHGNWRSNPT